MAVRGATRSTAAVATGAGGTSLARFAAFLAALAIAGGVLTFGVMHIPVQMAILPAGDRERYAPLAISGAVIVLAVTATWVAILRLRVLPSRARQEERAGSRPEAQEPATATTLRTSLAPLSVLRPELVPARLIVLTAAIALCLVVSAAVMAWPPWAIVSAAIIPWIPLFFVEGARKYRHYGLYAVFGAITLLQIGHLGEHSVQVAQVFMTDGELSRSHGVFGQLDFETVHFTWDTIVWLGLGALLARFGGENKWLWLSFAASSLHEIEHIYLFVIYRADPAFYMNGGLAGIMGFGGVVGSPLARPYLHFGYNVLVIVPLVVAFWAQTVRVYRGERDSPGTAFEPAMVQTAMTPSSAI